MSTEYDHQQNLDDARNGKIVFTHNSTLFQSLEIDAARRLANEQPVGLSAEMISWTSEYFEARNKVMNGIKNLFVIGGFLLFTILNDSWKNADFPILFIPIILLLSLIFCVFLLFKRITAIIKVPYKYKRDAPKKMKIVGKYPRFLERGRFQNNQTIFKVDAPHRNNIEFKVLDAEYREIAAELSFDDPVFVKVTLDGEVKDLQYTFMIIVLA